MTLFSSGQNDDDDELEYEFGGEEDADEVLEEADNGREDERGVELPGLPDERGVGPGLPDEVNMAWVPLALSSCAICCRFMSPMSELISASDMLPRSII